MYHKNKSSVYEKQWKREDIRQKSFAILTFYVDDLGFQISFRLPFCLGFVNPDSKTSKLKSVVTLHCTLYTVQYVPYGQELSTPETCQGRGNMW